MRYYAGKGNTGLTLACISQIQQKGQEGCLVHLENNVHLLCTFVGCYILLDGVLASDGGLSNIGYHG